MVFIHGVSLDWILSCIRDGERDVAVLQRFFQKAREDGFDVDSLDAEQEEELKQTLGVLNMATDGIEVILKENSDE